MMLKAPWFVLFLFLCSSAIFTFAEDDDNGDDEPVVLLFMSIGLMVGIIVMQVLSFLGDPIPYTCVVFILGAIFALADDRSAGMFGDSVSRWTDINAELLLFVFLPPLIFGEAMYLNWYHVRGGLAQAILLAGPGVLFGAAIMGCLAKYMLPYNWGWNLSMVFGSILSATDPVAVVALLKSASASPKLTILIVGESLLNDGTAMVLFELFYNALNGTSYSAADVVSFFVEAAIGSVLLGVGFGLVTVRWMRTANRSFVATDTTTQVAVTFCCAYLTFFTAQYVLEISGVLACCGAGGVLAKLAPPLILNHETMHHIWGMVEWVMNTLIFLLAGLIIGHRVLGEVEAMDWLYVIVLYILLMVVRVITIGLLFPFISNIGHKCTAKEAVFMAWAGLRGALGMALALIVNRGGPDDLDTETSRLFFYVGGIAALTLILNATTAKQLLVYLGLLGTDTPEKMLVRNQFKRKLQSKMDKVVTDMAMEFRLTDQDLEEVRMSCSLLGDSDLAFIRESEKNTIFPTDSAKNLDEVFDASLDDLLTMSTKNSPTPKLIQKSQNPLNPQSERSYNPVVERANSDADPSGSKLIFHAAKPTRSKSHGNMRAVKEGMDVQQQPGLYRSYSSGLNNGEGSYGKSRWNAEHTQALYSLSRMLSMNNRGPNPALMPELLSHVRGIFLEIVRASYWRAIEAGKLPRLSFSAQYLLYSIEVGLDQVHSPTPFHSAPDWECIKGEIDHTPPVVYVLSWWEQYAPCGCWTSQTLGRIEAVREKRSVYMLTSFIEAHEYAQKRIHAYLGLPDSAEDEVDPSSLNASEVKNVLEPHSVSLQDAENNGSRSSSTQYPPSPEELRVIAESQAAVTKARHRLQNMNPDTIAAIRSKQVSRLVLAKEAQIVRHMLEEGLLTQAHAEELLEEISNDTQRIERERNLMYREQGNLKAKQRIEQSMTGSFSSSRSSVLQNIFGGNSIRSGIPYTEQKDDRPLEDALLTGERNS